MRPEAFFLTEKLKQIVFKQLEKPVANNDSQYCVPKHPSVLVQSNSFYWTNYKIIKGEPVNLIQDVESAYKNSQDVIEDDEMTQPITVTKDQEEETSVKEFVEDEDDMNKYIDDNFVITE